MIDPWTIIFVAAVSFLVGFYLGRMEMWLTLKGPRNWRMPWLT